MYKQFALMWTKTLHYVPCVCFCLSFGMAYEFIDSIGNDVDVVSDSEVSSVCVYHLYIVNMKSSSVFIL